jgi:hypothetical protein
MLVIVLVAGVCRNPLVRDAYSIPDGLMVIAVILFWSFAADWLSYYSPWVHSLLHAPPIALIREGQVLRENLRKELLTEERLCAKLREHGVKNLGQVAEAYMEGDGRVSVLKKDDGSNPGPPAGSDACHGNSGWPRASPEGTDPAQAAVPLSELKSAPANAGGAQVDTFLQAAKGLQERIVWHQQQIAFHQGEIAAIKEALGRHGFRLRDPTRPARDGSRPPSTP